jgi:hypothetical protein
MAYSICPLKNKKKQMKKLLLILLTSILLTGQVIVHSTQTNKIAQKFYPSKADTDESNCCKQNKDCISEADVVKIVRGEEPNVLELFWWCEKGANDISLKLPDTLLTDTRIYTNDPHKWQAHKIKYINDNEFIIENWRWDTCVNHFVRARVKD